MPSRLRPLLLAAGFVAAVMGASTLPARPLYKIEKRIPLSGTTGWDLLAMDSAAHRLYVSRGTHVDVIDTVADSVTAVIDHTDGVHGIAIAADLGKVYTTNGASNTVSVLDRQTLALQATLPTGEKPDALLYDAFSQRVFVFNAKGQSCTVIDAVKGTVLKTVALPGQPELPVTDGAGHLFVNLEDKSDVVVLDAKKLTVTSVWPLAPGEEPTGLALDPVKHRLYSACANGKMIVTDSLTGQPVADLPIGQHPDGAAFDPGTGLAFASNGEGSLSILGTDPKGALAAFEALPTQKGARTLVLDPADHRIYSICAKYAKEAKSDAKEHKRPAILDGSVEVLVLSYRPEAPGKP